MTSELETGRREGAGRDASPSNDPPVAPPPTDGGWLRVRENQRVPFWAAVVSALLLVLGGFGPWVKLGPISAAGTDGDGWFLIAGGVVAGALLLRLNSRRGERDRIAWLIPIAGAVGAIAVLIDLVEIQKSDFVTVGWGAWLGAIAGTALVGVSVYLLFPAVRGSIAAVLASLAVAGGGVAVGIATAEDTSFSDSGSETDIFSTEDTTQEAPPPPSIDVTDRGFSQDNGSASYGVVLRNSSTDLGAMGVTVTVNLLDSVGTVISTETAEVAAIPPSSEFGVAGSSSIEGEQVARLEIIAEATEGDETPPELPTAGSVRLIDGDFGREARVEIANTLTEPLSSIADVFFLFRNTSGKIIGGEQTFPDADIPPSGRAAVEAMEIPEATAEAEVYVDAES
jgi:hypothetical protein